MANESFYDVITQAIADFAKHGYDSAERMAYWQERIRQAAERSMTPAWRMEEQLRASMGAIYKRMVENAGALRYHPGVSRFTLDSLRPRLHDELRRRILASADLIRLNRSQAIEKTLQRFSGWASSVPTGGSKTIDRVDEKKTLRKALTQLPFEERRVLVDQGTKLVASINQVIASDGGAIAVKWNSHWREINYNYREDHKERDGQIYLIRGSWASKGGLVQQGEAGYYDEVTAVAEEPFCFPGDSEIPFADGIEAAFRRWYVGDLVEMVTSSGNRLKGTPNHPVLTSKGWVALGCLKEGDNVVEICEKMGLGLERDNHGTKARISDVFAAVGRAGFAEKRSGGSHQFHGDGSERDVDVVRAARPLTFDSMTPRPKRLDQGQFSLTNLRRSAGRAFDFCLHGVVRSAQGVVSGLGQLLSPLLALSRHPNQICLAAPSLHQPALFDGAHNHGAGDVKVSGDLEHASPFRVQPANLRRGQVDSVVGGSRDCVERDLLTVNPAPERARIDAHDFGDLFDGKPFSTQLGKVVEVERNHWSGHVYNLQTEAGWYVTQNIITHNCRCFATYIYHLRQLPPDMLTKKGQLQLEEARRKIAAL